MNAEALIVKTSGLEMTSTITTKTIEEDFSNTSTETIWVGS